MSNGFELFWLSILNKAQSLILALMALRRVYIGVIFLINMFSSYLYDMHGP